MVSESDLRVYLDQFDKKYWATYKVLDILQKVFYRSAAQLVSYIAQTAVLGTSILSSACTRHSPSGKSC